MSKPKHILIVDDEPEIRKIIQEILNDEGYSTSTASSAEEARIEQITKNQIWSSLIYGCQKKMA